MKLAFLLLGMTFVAPAQKAIGTTLATVEFTAWAVPQQTNSLQIAEGIATFCEGVDCRVVTADIPGVLAGLQVGEPASLMVARK